MSFPKYPAYKDSGVEWIGEIPVGWEVKSLRFALSDIFNGSTATQVEPSNDTMAVTRIETISGGKINLEKVGYINKAESEERKILKNGDIIFSNINSLKMIGNCAIFYGDFLLHSGMNLITLRPNSSVYPKFILYVLKSTLCREEIESRAKPAINQASISQQSICDIKIPDIPLPEQQAIASFLDRECGKIDALIAEQERLIALLAEKRQAVISHAVTKGLNPNAPMKDSGIPWIGMVPEGWEVVRLSLVSDHISSGTTPDTNNENFYDGDICWVTTGELREAAIKNTTKKVTKLALEKFSALQIYPPGTLLLAMYGATVGRIAWLETHATTNQACCALVFSKKIKMKFVFYTMLAAKESLLLLSSGGGQPNINQEKVRSFRIPVPSLSEQSKIIDFLDSNMKDLDSLSGKIEKTLLLFKERRSALISAAVTGKIDVRAQSKAIAA